MKIKYRVKREIEGKTTWYLAYYKSWFFLPWNFLDGSVAFELSKSIARCAEHANKTKGSELVWQSEIEVK